MTTTKDASEDQSSSEFIGKVLAFTMEALGAGLPAIITVIDGCSVSLTVSPCQKCTVLTIAAKGKEDTIPWFEMFEGTAQQGVSVTRPCPSMMTITCT